jgi:peptidoglycan/xylan/chitin deacetylase (PgdA/CDA1 family)
MNNLDGIVEVAGATAAVAAGALACAVRIPSCSWLAPSVSYGAFTRRAIALTFDDGPSESTPQLLEILARHRATATFFQCGANVRRLPAIAREITTAGHEVGNHTESHPLLALKPPDLIYRELAAAQESIESATGIRPRYFRAPYGARWFGLRKAQARLGLQGIMWSTIALDWKRPAPAVVERLLRGATPGAILCLHDGRVLEPKPDISVTLQAVRELLPKLIDQGFQLENITGILRPSTAANPET